MNSNDRNHLDEFQLKHLDLMTVECYLLSVFDDWLKDLEEYFRHSVFYSFFVVILGHILFLNRIVPLLILASCLLSIFLVIWCAATRKLITQ